MAGLQRLGAFGAGLRPEHGSIIPVNTSLAFPTLGGTTTDLSLSFTQKFSDAFSVSLGKFNMLDAAAKTPLMGGGGETTFWNTAFAAPVSGVTPPYIFGAIATLKTAPATFTLMIYDPRNAQSLDVIAHPFEDGTTASLSATVPLMLFGLTGYAARCLQHGGRVQFRSGAPAPPAARVARRPHPPGLLLRLLFAAAVPVG